MKRSLLERYGSFLALGLVTLFAWRLIASGLHDSPEFSLLFPLTWLERSPLGPFLSRLVQLYGSTAWWEWVEIAFTVGVWLLLYFSARGIFYTVAFMEGPSMWIAFAGCIVLAVLFFFLLIHPAFQQMAIWWRAWPGVQQPVYPQ